MIELRVASFKMNMLQLGVDKALRDIIVGHTLRGMDVFYLKPSDEDLTAAMDRFIAWLDTHLFSESVEQTVGHAKKYK